MTVDCDVATRFLSVVWFVVGALIAGPFAYFAGKRVRPQSEFTYRGRGGEE